MFGIVERVWACVCVSGWCPRFPSGRSEDVGTVCHEAKLLNICRMRTDSCCFYAPVVSLFGKIAIFADARALCQHPDTGGVENSALRAHARYRRIALFAFTLSFSPPEGVPRAVGGDAGCIGRFTPLTRLFRHRGRVFTAPR